MIYRNYYQAKSVRKLLRETGTEYSKRRAPEYSKEYCLPTDPAAGTRHISTGKGLSEASQTPVLPADTMHTTVEKPVILR